MRDRPRRQPCPTRGVRAGDLGAPSPQRRSRTWYRRWPQFVLIVSVLGRSRLGMMAVPELGHVLAGWAGGASVTKVVLHPLVLVAVLADAR